MAPQEERKIRRALKLRTFKERRGKLIEHHPEHQGRLKTGASMMRSIREDPIRWSYLNELFVNELQA